jgi:hypothetical protein
VTTEIRNPGMGMTGRDLALLERAGIVYRLEARHGDRRYSIDTTVTVW